MPTLTPIRSATPRAFSRLLFLMLCTSACSSPSGETSTSGQSSTAGVGGTNASAGNTKPGQGQIGSGQTAAQPGAAGAGAAASGSSGNAAQGTPNQTGAAASGGQPSTAGQAGSNGSAGNQAGAAASTTGQAGATASNAAGTTGASTTTPASCPSATSPASVQPFGCNFAWGTNDPGGSLSAFAGLNFMSKWVGYEIDMSGNLPKCDGCSWLHDQVASTQLVPVYYAYFIGYFGKANGLPDGNENPNGPNLTTDAAKLIRAQKPKLISLYRDYAKQTAQAWPDKPIVWLLEGDFVQYTGDSQKEPLSYDELAALGQDISCAIKSEMPNAIVAINHSTWNSNEVTNSFWNAMSKVSYDLVWTTGVANNNGFFEKDTDASKYNADSAKYAYVHKLTGRGIFVDTSFGLSEMADSWSGADAATLNARIDEGVIAANVTKPPDGYVAKATMLQAQLKPVCQ